MSIDAPLYKAVKKSTIAPIDFSELDKFVDGKTFTTFGELYVLDLGDTEKQLELAAKNYQDFRVSSQKNINQRHTDYTEEITTRRLFYEGFDADRQICPSLKQVSSQNTFRRPANVVKNNVLHIINNHLDFAARIGCFGALTDLLLIKFSVPEFQFKIIVGGIRQRIIFLGNHIEFTEDYEANNNLAIIDLKKAITLLLLQTLFDLCFGSKPTNQLISARVRLIAKIQQCRFILDENQTEVYFREVADEIVIEILNDFNGGYDLENQRVLTNGFFGDGFNLKYIEFVDLLNNLTLNKYMSEHNNKRNTYEFQVGFKFDWNPLLIHIVCLAIVGRCIVGEDFEAAKNKAFVEVKPHFPDNEDPRGIEVISWRVVSVDSIIPD